MVEITTVTARRPMTNEMRIQIDFMTYWKIQHWIDKADFREVQGLGKVVSENGVFKVTSAILLPQKVGATSTEIDAKDVGKAMFFLKDEPGELRFWWHSHVKMPVFWSGTDTDTIQELGDGGWYVCTVFNQRRESRTCLYQKSPNLFVDGQYLHVGAPNFYQATYDEWNKDFDDNVKSMYAGTVYGFESDSESDLLWQKTGKIDTYMTKKWGRVLVDELDRKGEHVWMRKAKGSPMFRIALSEIIEDAKELASQTKALKAAGGDDGDVRMRAMFPSWDSLDLEDQLKILDTYGGAD